MSSSARRSAWQSNYQGIKHTIDAHEFANQIDHNLGLYKPDITYSQLNLLVSHDTPRFLSCVSGDKSALKLAWLFQFAYPGAPNIYYGDEIGLDGKHDPDCRKSFPWDENKWDKNLLAYMKELMQANPDNSPAATDLREVFHIPDRQPNPR